MSLEFPLEPRKLGKFVVTGYYLGGDAGYHSKTFFDRESLAENIKNALEKYGLNLKEHFKYGHYKYESEVLGIVNVDVGPVVSKETTVHVGLNGGWEKKVRDVKEYKRILEIIESVLESLPIKISPSICL